MADWPDLHKDKFLPFMRGTNHDDAVARFQQKYGRLPKWIVLTLDDYACKYGKPEDALACVTRSDGVMVVWAASQKLLISLGPIPEAGDA